MSLTRNQILGAEDRTHEDVEVEEWGGTLRLVAPSGPEREDILVAWNEVDEDDDENTRAYVRMFPYMIASMAYEILPDGTTGDRLFTLDDVPSLRQKNGAVLANVGQSAMRLAGFTSDVSEEGEDD